MAAASKLPYLGILLLLVVALALRLAGIWIDLPLVYHWDEPTLVDNAVWLQTDGTLDPRFFNYPGGMIYLLSAEFGLARLLGTLSGVFPSMAASLEWMSAGTYVRPVGGEILYRFPTEGVSSLYLLGRTTSAILGTIAVYFAFRIGERVGGRWLGSISGCALALSPLHGPHSGLATTDVACSAFLTWFAYELLERNSWKRIGAALGLAAAFKYTGGIGVYTWPAGLLLASLPLLAMGTGERRAWNGLWFRAILVAGSVFLLLNPFAIVAPAEFLEDFRSEAIHMHAGTEHFESDVGIASGGAGAVWETIETHLGWPGAIGLLLSLFWWIRERRFPIALLWVWSVIYMWQLGTWKTVYDRYLIPIWPILVLLSAFGWWRCALLLERRMVGKYGRLASHVVPCLLALGVLVGPTVPTLARSLQSRLAPDVRTEMSAWIDENLDPFATIASEPSGPHLDSERRTIIYVDLLGRKTAEEYRTEGVRYLVATGREQLLPPSAPAELVERHGNLLDDRSPLWEQEKYAIYDLGSAHPGLDRARHLLESGDAPGAISAVSEVLRQAPALGPAWMLFAEAHASAGDLSKAKEGFARAATLLPEDPTPLYGLGNVYLEEEDWEEAMTVFTASLELDPQSPVGANNLATAFAYAAREASRSGDAARATALMREAVEVGRVAGLLDPTDTHYRGLEADLRARAKRWGIPLNP